MVKNIKSFFILFFIQIVGYALLCINYRAVGRGEYVTSAISDFMIASLTFFVIKKIADDESKSVLLWLGYALGSIVGSVLGIWISKTYLN